MSEEKYVYYCVVCGREIEADEYGVVVHDDVPGEAFVARKC